MEIIKHQRYAYYLCYFLFTALTISGERVLGSPLHTESKKSFYLTTKERKKSLQFLVITGTIDPRLSTQFLVNYQTQAARCLQTINLLEGVTRPHVKVLHYDVVPSTSNTFSLTLPINHLPKGPCHWYVSSLGYVIEVKNHVSINDQNQLFFYAPLTVKPFKVSSHTHINIHCQQSGWARHGLFCMQKQKRLTWGLSRKTKNITLNISYVSQQGRLK